MSAYQYQPLFEFGSDKTPYRKLTTDGISTVTVDGLDFLRVDPNVLRELSRQAFDDIAHLLRPGHLAQLQKVVNDPESSANDKFVAMELLRNANIAAGRVLPGCQDTGTAIVMAHKGERVLTGGDDAEAISHGVFDAYEQRNLRYSQLAPIDMFTEKNTGSNLPAQVDIYSEPGDEYTFLFVAKGGGSANKTFLYQETKALLNPPTLLEFVEAKLKESDDRHRQLGDSRYVIEPNIKDGKGGLRDLHKLFWIGKYAYKTDDVSALVSEGVLSLDDARRFAKAQKQLWTIRCHLHYLAGREEDRLTVDHQREIAKRLGYMDRSGNTAVERFMRHYYLTAKDVGDLTRIFCAAIEEEHQRKPLLAIVVLRYYEAVGLDTAVDLRAVGACQSPGGLQPGGFSGLEIRGTFETGVEYLQRFLDVALVVELSRVTQQPFARLGVDLRIEETILRDPDHLGFFPEPVETFAQFFEFSPDLSELFFGRDIGIRGAGPAAWKAGQYT